MSAAPHTAGPWRWEFNRKHKMMHLVGGKPTYDLTIMDFDRWGMNRAVATLRDTAHDGMNIMHRVCDRPDWVAPFAGRAHHADWCADIVHPDMRLMAAAPDLLAALRAAVESGLVPITSASEGGASRYSAQVAAADMIRAAIAKATGAE